MAKPNWANFRGYWNLDEAGGSNAIDSTANGNDLVETSGTIESLEGGRDFELTESEYFKINDNASLSFADEELTFGVWVKLESQAGSQALIGKRDTTNSREYRLEYYDTADRYRLRISSDGEIVGNTNLQANSYGAVPATTKAFVLAWHDPVANKIYIQVNNGVVDEVAHAGGIFNGTAPFSLGAFFAGGAAANYFDGIEWCAFVYAGLMTAAERTWMYNAGVPRKWSEIYFVPRAGMI